MEEGSTQRAGGLLAAQDREAADEDQRVVAEVNFALFVSVAGKQAYSPPEGNRSDEDQWVVVKVSLVFPFIYVYHYGGRQAYSPLAVKWLPYRMDACNTRSIAGASTLPTLCPPPGALAIFHHTYHRNTTLLKGSII